MRKFYSPIDRLAEQMTRGKGTGAEFMTELGNKPGFKQAEVEDRNLQALQSMPKMSREDFIANLKAQRPMMPEEDIRGEGDTHHDEYTLPGGSNYREILLQHPHGNYPGVREHFGGAPNVLASMRVKDRLAPNLEGPYAVKVTGHGGTSTVKHKTREDAERFADVKRQGGYATEINPLENKKILHIEEIQSDWHKKGSQKGYAPVGEDMYDTAKQAERAYHLLAAKRREASEKSRSAEIALASDKPLYQDPEVRARYTEALKGYDRDIMDLTPQVMKAEEAHRVAKERAHSAVPDAPFKKSWHELALKRMIQHAAQKGYDEIHITPGAEQAARWGASGEGAKGFHDLYDKMLPQFLNKFGKPYGAQVGTSGLHGVPELDEDHDEADVDSLAKMRATPMHSFPITPQMREDVVTKGMPLYADGGEVKSGDDVKYSVRDDKGVEYPCNDFMHAQNKARSMLSYRKTSEAHILEDGVPKWQWALGKTLSPVEHKAKGGAVSRGTTKPVVRGIIKERVTVAPDKDMMLYELMSAKRFTKKVK